MEYEILKSQVQEFLQDMLMSSTTELIDLVTANDKDEIISLATKRGIDLKKSEDLAGFKTIFAIADKANKNKCRLPKDIVSEALETINGKPVDVDHIRKYVVGHYLGARMDGDMIIAYGVFYKSNFAEEWAEAEKLLKAGKLTTSFEIRCPVKQRKSNSDGTVSLMSIDIMGGGLLFRTKPAYPEAKVLETAKDRSEIFDESLVLANEDIIVSKQGGNEMENVENKPAETEVVVSAEAVVETNPSEAQATEEPKSVPEQAASTTVVTKQESIETRTMEHNKTNVQTDFKTEGVVTLPDGSQEIRKSEGQSTYTYEYVQAEIAKAVDAKEKEIQAKVVSLTEKSTKIEQELAEVKAKLESKEKEMASLIEAKTKDVEFYKANAKALYGRRQELGEFAKDLSDEQLLNADKYENAQLKKQLVEVKSTKTGDINLSSIEDVKEPKKDLKEISKLLTERSKGLTGGF